MTMRIAINGFGRIGRNVLRALVERRETGIEVVAVNDLAPPAMNVHLFKYDSVHGRFPGEVRHDGDTMDVGTGPIRLLAERDPAKLPWKALGVDLVMECTGLFTSRDKAAAHLEAGARKVLVSAPADGVDLTVVYGVNHQALRPEHIVVSNASCTTNCLAPLAYVLHRVVGIERGHMTTIHAYTNDQRLLDVVHKDPRRARAAALSMIPTSTGAARAVGLVLPELKGKLDGVAIRVPCANVSLVDLTFVPSRPTDAEEIAAALRQAEKGELAGILACHDEPLVSIDFNHTATSSNVDLTSIKVLENRLVRVASWYDNEWGFSNRMIDTARAMMGA
ncbi:Glyceraldehyde-3-phosphate dehydrogenase [bacterium HR40]|nr:Glyceraldehyde-3-phosphate dehydrogenase [bacterium HR40]